MTARCRHTWRGLFAGLVVLSLAGSAARAAISLDWQPNLQTVNVGNVVSVGLYAISDGSPPNQSMLSLDVILNWDPSKLQLLSLTNNSPYGWSQSQFPNDCGLDGMNGNPVCPAYTGLPANDGNAFYRALGTSGQAGTPAYATPAGLLIATFNFLAVAQTPSTVINIPANFGNFTHTRIQDGFTAGLFVQTPPPWGSSKIEIVPEPATLLLLAGAATFGLRRRR